MDNPKITIDIPDPIAVLFNHLISQPTTQRGRYGKGFEVYDPIVTIKSESLHFNLPIRVDSFTKLECGEGMFIGKYVHIASFCHLGIGGGLLILEQGSSCGSGVKIITGSNVPGNGHGCSAIDPAAIIKRSFVHVKRNATLFCGAIVLPGVTIGEGAVIAAGAVVTKDVPAGETWSGVPAKRITKKYTNSEIEAHLLEEFDRLQKFTKKLKRSEAKSEVESKCDPSCGCGVPSLTSFAVDLQDSKMTAPSRSIGEQSLDMWVAAQAEMYCWDDDNKEKL